jgi:hypothetical protein
MRPQRLRGALGAGETEDLSRPSCCVAKDYSLSGFADILSLTVGNVESMHTSHPHHPPHHRGANLATYRYVEKNMERRTGHKFSWGPPR